MLIQILILSVIILGVVVFYFYFIAPKLNPLNRAKTLLDQNLVDEALVEYKKTLDTDPSNISAHFKLADIFFNKKKDIDQCVIHLETLLKNNIFNYEVEKHTVQRMLASCYNSRGELEKAFQQYVDILRVYPGDFDSLYNAAFISLGQEYFETAQKFFDRLCGQNKKSFEILFGAGIASYQNQKTTEAAAYFREALSINPHSDIGNLAMTFTYFNKKDYKTALNYVKMIVDSSKDETAIFIAKRFLAILYTFIKNPLPGVKTLQELLANAKSNEIDTEISLLLFDLGFICLSAEMTHEAYDYWNELYQIDRNYKNVQYLITILRREMADTPQYEKIDETALADYYAKWKEDLFPENFLWNICGLKSETFFDLKNTITTIRSPLPKDHSSAAQSQAVSYSSEEIIDRFFAADPETFRIISNRVLGKIGYKVDEILPTYREHDGVDFSAVNISDKTKALIWVRRWKGVHIGEIPLRNFAQAVNDFKAKKGIFISATPLTASGEAAKGRLSKIEVILPQRLAELLADLI